jgi:coenzyme F420-reducing hydrogenase delta subunit
MSKAFEPKILGFLCNWCSYAGADLAGISRIQYPPNIRIIRVMCSGRVDPVFVVHAFEKGMDGVLVLGCHPGDCHYMTGNYQAERKMKTIRKLLHKIGISDERFHLDWVSAAEGGRFARLVADFTEGVRALGPLGKSEGRPKKELARSLATARNVLESQRLRWLVGREMELTEDGNVYGEKVDAEEFDELVVRTMDDLLARERILNELQGVERSVRELSDSLSIGREEIFEQITYLLNSGNVVMTGHKGTSPLYSAVSEHG